MKQRRRGMGAAAVLGLAAVALAASAGAEQEPRAEAEVSESEGSSSESDADAVAELPVYQPPARGKPRARIGGGVRGSAQAVPTLIGLVPEHVARTLAAKPRLFWHLDRLPAPGTPFVFTLVDDREIDPVVEGEIPAPERPGIQAIDLAGFGVSLERGVEYQWSVSLVMDREQRAKDVVATGWIHRVAPPPELSEPVDPHAALYAKHGLWYDALAEAEARLAAAPSDARARRVRDALLRQAGLEAVLASSAPDPEPSSPE